MLKKMVKDSIMGKSGYQCARGDFSMTGKILFGQTEGNLRQGVTAATGHLLKGGVLCEMGMRVERWLWRQQHPYIIKGGWAVRSYSSLTQKCEFLHITHQKPHSLDGLFFIVTSVCNYARGQHPEGKEIIKSQWEWAFKNQLRPWGDCHYLLWRQ